MFEGLIIFGQKISDKSQRILVDLNKHFSEEKHFFQKNVTLCSQQNIINKPSKIINLLRKTT